MKFCIPSSKAFSEKKAVFMDLVDAVTFKAPEKQIFPGKSNFLECSFNIADSELPDLLQKTGYYDALKSGRYESFACDIGPNCRTIRDYSPNRFPRAIPQSNPISDEEYLRRARQNVQWLRGEFPGFIQVENLNYFPTGAYETVCEPDFVRRLIHETGLGLLLDIGHAAVSAQYMKFPDTLSYLKQLPLGAVREIQLSCSGFLNDIYEDLHEAPGEGEFAIVKDLVMECPAEYLTIEYYQDADRLVGIYKDLNAEWSRLKPTS